MNRLRKPQEENPMIFNAGDPIKIENLKLGTNVQDALNPEKTGEIIGLHARKIRSVHVAWDATPGKPEVWKWVALGSIIPID